MNTQADRRMPPLIRSLQSMNDSEIRIYTRLATQWRDQRLAEGSSAEVAFWNSLIGLLIEEHQGRMREIRQLESMYRGME